MNRPLEKSGTLWVVSACLAGQACRYDGKATPLERVRDLVRRGLALPVCPEQMGGLPTPRDPAEIAICGCQGARVVTAKGQDVTDAFVRGARQALELARLFGARSAILKSRSPSCGCGRVYDGTFSGALVHGHGVFAEMLMDEGFSILTDEDMGQ